MLKLFLLTFVCITIVVLVNGQEVSPLARLQWQHFKEQFDKQYSPEEEPARFEIFKENLKHIEKLNAFQPHRPFGVTKFMDLSPDEFKDLYLMKKVPKRENKPLAPRYNATQEALPETFSWLDRGVLTPIKNQGQCGSCWDFSCVETLESVCALGGYGLVALSEQQVLDCDVTKYSHGCAGGLPAEAFEYIIEVGGIETEEDYPYLARDGTCHANKDYFVPCKPYLWGYVTKDRDESVMMEYVYYASPLSVCVDASTWQYYTSGVVMGSSCGQQLDHCVQIVGWTSVDGVLAWIVRNSWGANWGIHGYLLVQRGVNACGIADEVTVPCVHDRESGKRIC